MRRDSWREDRLGLDLESGLGPLRAAEPDAGGWDRLAAAIEADRPLARRWPAPISRLAARLLGERALSWPLRELRLRSLSVGSAALMLALTAVSAGQILSRDADVALGPPQAQAAGDLHPTVQSRLDDARPASRGEEALDWARATVRAEEAEALRSRLHARIGQRCTEVFDHPLWQRYDSPSCRRWLPGPSPLGALPPLDRLGGSVRGL